MNRKLLLIVFTITVAVVSSACSSPSPKIAITTAPPASMEINVSAPIVATVTHDSADKGVDWSCSPAGSCGTFNPAHTDDGAATAYTAPAVAGAVTITASSTKKSSVTATAMVNVTAVASASSLSGQYAFYVSGFDAAGNFYCAAGSVTLDGAGNVTAGEEDLNNSSYAAAVVGDALTGTYTVGNDGQGTMVLNATTGGVADPLVGVAGVQTLALTVVNNNHAIVSEFDAAATSGGSLDLQSAAAITGGFVGNFAMAAHGYLSGSPWAFGGILNSTGTSSTGTADQDIAGTPTTGIVTGGAVTAPDASGRGTFVLGTLNFSYYIVGAEAVRFVETDIADVTGGSAFGQGSAAPAFSAASVSGPFVIDEPWPSTASAGGPVSLAGQFHADGTSAITGVVDYNEAGVVPPGPGPDTLAANYAVPASGYGSITSGVVSNDADFTTWGLYLTDSALNLVDPNNPSGGGGALIVELDANDLGAGFLVPQTATAGTSVNNGVDFVAFNNGDDFINSVGQVVAASGTITGTASVNDLNPGTPSQAETTGVTLAGPLTADASNAGRYTLPLTVGGAATPTNLVVYFASAGLAVIVDVDSTVGPPAFAQVGSGTVQGQQ